MAKSLAVVAACLMLAGSAQGASTYLPGEAMQRWQAVASARFPVACSPALYVADPGERPSYIQAWADPELCRVTLAPSYFRESRAHRCAILVHEYGHLAGLAHSTDPHSIMYPRAPVVGARRCQKGP